MTPHAFIKWRASALKERSASQEHWTRTVAGEHPQADAAGRQVLYGVFTAVLKFTSQGFERE